MIETHNRTIAIETDKGTFEVNFNPSVPYGFEELQNALVKHIANREFCEAMALKHKKDAGIYWLKKQSEDAEEFIKAIQTALWDDEFAKVKDVLRQIDVDSLVIVATKILDEYMDHYRKTMSEGLEP